MSFSLKLALLVSKNRDSSYIINNHNNDDSQHQYSDSWVSALLHISQTVTILILSGGTMIAALTDEEAEAQERVSDMAS